MVGCCGATSPSKLRMDGEGEAAKTPTTPDEKKKQDDDKKGVTFDKDVVYRDSAAPPLQAGMSSPDRGRYSQTRPKAIPQFETGPAPRPADEVLNNDETAIIVVDFQHDFMEGGNLAVSGADYGKYKDDVVAFVEKCRGKGRVIVWSQDWHPEDHQSFAKNHDGGVPFTQKKLSRPKESGEIIDTDQTLWPVHCVQGSKGAEFVTEVREGEFVQQKGTMPPWDSYSAFMDDGGHPTGLADHLKNKGIKATVCFGLALDFCVYFTAKDSCQSGFSTYWIPELCRGIDPEFENSKYDTAGCYTITLPEANKALE
ncbi:unnamed protein product [Amoebophrya sp. A120]|nr:unnamed protein product [Amoebophrya sp. A120]|eukprot:GSA120T00019364001.1